MEGTLCLSASGDGITSSSPLVPSTCGGDGGLWTWPSGIGPSLMQLPHVARHLVIALRCFLVHAYAGTPGAQRPSRPHRSHCWLPISFSHSGDGGGDVHGGGATDDEDDDEAAADAGAAPL